MKSGWRVIAAALIAAGTTCAEAHAAEARLLRVALLRSAGRISLALEMTTEPKKASLRALSDKILELETGPVVGPIREEELAPESVVPVIRHVSIRRYSTGRSAVFVRARMMLYGSGRADVRVTGRVVYVDFAVPAAEPPIPTFQEVSVPARDLVRPVAGGLPPSREASAADSGEGGQASGPVSPADVLHAAAYREAVQPLVLRLTEIGPFLLSAAAAPAEDVLAAVSRTVMDVERSLRAMEVPPASRSAHDQLFAGVAAARRSVAPDFRGDRVAQARHALALVETVRRQETGGRR